MLVAPFKDQITEEKQAVSIPDFFDAQECGYDTTCRSLANNFDINTKFFHYDFCFQVIFGKNKEVVLLFRPVCSQLKMDQGFT